MPFDLTNRLVVGLASSALFDLSESDEVFRSQGEQTYRKYQLENQDVALKCAVVTNPDARISRASVYPNLAMLPLAIYLHRSGVRCVALSENLVLWLGSANVRDSHAGHGLERLKRR